MPSKHQPKTKYSISVTGHISGLPTVKISGDFTPLDINHLHNAIHQELSLLIAKRANAIRIAELERKQKEKLKAKELEENGSGSNGEGNSGVEKEAGDSDKSEDVDSGHNDNSGGTDSRNVSFQPKDSRGKDAGGDAGSDGEADKSASGAEKDSAKAKS